MATNPPIEVEGIGWFVGIDSLLYAMEDDSLFNNGVKKMLKMELVNNIDIRIYCKLTS